jgi:riboflavin synthase alpha subunit
VPTEAGQTGIVEEVGAEATAGRFGALDRLFSSAKGGQTASSVAQAGVCLGF